jgi:hypothetical protein
LTARRPTAIAIAALLLAVVAAWAAATQNPLAGASPAAGTADRATVVGEVTALTAGRLSATPARGGRRTTLRQGSVLRLGDVVSIGPGTRATIVLTRPRGVPSDAELVFLRSSDGRARELEMRSRGTRQTIITIG